MFTLIVGHSKFNGYIKCRSQVWKPSKMKVLIICVLCAIAGGAFADHEDSKNTTTAIVEESNDLLNMLKKSFAVKEKWLEVPVNHFDLFDNTTWKMRYLVSDRFYKPGGPIFIEVGGEWTIDGTSLAIGILPELAKKHHGMLVETEHRYYGQSIPFAGEFEMEKFKYLQMEQALEDIAYFVEKFKATVPSMNSSKVVVHGCSYPGMLVTWMRLRFPHIVDIAYASSAPLGVGLDYPEFFEIVNDVYANVSSDCIGTIREGFNETTQLLKTLEGRTKVREAFKDWTCGDIDKMNSMEILQKIIGVLNVMHDPSQYEEVACLTMSLDDDDLAAYQRLANFIILKSKHIANCKSEETDEVDINSLSWAYQTCTEMGTFQTLNRKNSHHPFEMDLSVEESVADCVEQFGGIVTEHVLKTGIERVNRRYGGTKPKVTKVVSIQGTHDPWKHLAHLEDYGPEAPVWVVDGSHCADVTVRSDDSEQLTGVRVRVKNLITKWLEEISAQ